MSECLISFFLSLSFFFPFCLLLPLMNFTAWGCAVSCVTSANTAGLESRLWGRMRFQEVQAQPWQPPTPLSWFHFLAAVMLSLRNCPYENQVHQSKHIYLVPRGELSSFEKGTDARCSLDQYIHYKQKIWFIKCVLKKYIIISLANCSKDHWLYTDCIYYWRLQGTR